MRAIIVLVVMLASCTPAKYPQPECNTEALIHLDAAYVAEAAEVCRGQRWEDCEELPGIRAKYDAIREGWVQCGN